MKTRFASLLVVLAAFMALLLMPIVGPPKPAAATGSFSYNFESTLAPWVPGAHYTIEQYGNYQLRRLNDDNACPTNGQWYANLGTNIGNYSRAPVWMTAAFEGTGAGTRNTVTMSWKVKNKANCGPGLGGCSATVYVGTTAPNSTTAFTDKALIENDWTDKNHTQSITLDSNNTIYIALGWRSIYVEPDQLAPAQQIGFDCITINITTDTNQQPPP